MFKFFLLFLITLTVADILDNVDVDIGSKDRLLDEYDDSVHARRNLKITPAGNGRVRIDLESKVGLLPDILVDLRDPSTFKGATSISFKWKMEILYTLSDLIYNTIGKMDGMPSLRTEQVEFDAYYDTRGFGFDGKYLGWELACTVDFDQKDFIHCKYGNSFFAVMAENLSDITDTAKLIFMETSNMFEDTGDIIAVGSRAAVEVGAKVIDGMTKGIIAAASSVQGELQAIVGGTKDWCDCGKKGQLRVWASGTETYYLHARSDYQMILWGKNVSTVYWRCTDGGKTQRANFHNGGSTWMVKFKHERKYCRKSGDYWPKNHSSGRVYWK